jgi:hypothetical protein
MNYEDLSGPDGSGDNMGGTKQFFYYAPVRYFDTIKEPTDNPTDLASYVEITEDHEFLPGKGFHKMYCTEDKGKGSGETQGDRDGRSLKQMAEFFYPGSDSTIHGFAAKSKNDRFIVLYPMPDGKVNQIGNNDFYAEILCGFGTETNSAGVRGHSIKVESMGTRQLVYTGEITLFADEAGS